VFLPLLRGEMTSAEAGERPVAGGHDRRSAVSPPGREKTKS
jgi:hypothetical protein